MVDVDVIPKNFQLCNNILCTAKAKAEEKWGGGGGEGILTEDFRHFAS